MNPINHFEIPADDVGGLKKFYADLFGWKIADPFGMGYEMVQTTPSDEQGQPTTPGAVNGGMPKRTAPGEQPTLVITVPDVRAHLDRIKAAGGEVVVDVQEVGTMGLYARFKDPQGNLMGLWQTLEPTGE